MCKHEIDIDIDIHTHTHIYIYTYRNIESNLKKKYVTIAITALGTVSRDQAAVATYST